MTQETAPIAADERSPRRGILRFLAGSSLLLGMRGFAAAAIFAVHILLARWMGTEQLGYYVAAFSWCLILTRFATLGFAHSSLRFIPAGMAAGDPGAVRGYVRRTRQLVIGASLVLAIGALAVMTLLMDADDPLLPVLRVAVLCTPLLAWLGVQGGYALALSRPWIFMMNTFLRPTGLCLGVVIAWLAMDSLGALDVMWIHGAVMLAVAALQLVLLGRVFARSVPPAPPRYETRDWLSTGLPLMLVTLYGSLFFEYNVVFLVAWMPADAIGVFSVAYKLAFLLGFVKWAVDSASLPRLSRLYHDPEQRVRLQEDLTSATRLQTAIAAVGFLGLLVLGRTVLRLIGGDFAEGYAVMLVLAASLVVRSALGPAAELLGITGHQRVSLVVCAAGLLAAPLLLRLLVPGMGMMGAALAILAVTTASSLWLHREARRRLGVHASVLGSWSLRAALGLEDLRCSLRRSRVVVCGPDVVRKRCEELVSEEYAKVEAVWKAAQGDDLFVAPRALAIDEKAMSIDIEYVSFQSTVKECYIEYVTAPKPRPEPMHGLLAQAGAILARIHRCMRLPVGEEWRPSDAVRADLERCGVSVHAVTALPSVPLHGDFCPQNIAYRIEGGRTVPVVIDPSPDFVSTFHPWAHGPPYVDVSLFLSCLDGRVPLRHYPRIKWSRIPELKEIFLASYNECAERPVDKRIADVMAYCVAREYFRRRFRVEPLARGAAWLLYNPFNGNAPRAWMQAAGNARAS